MRPARRGERGAVAVLVALVVLMLVAFLGLALNMGHLFSVRGELQNAADAGALAGVKELNGTPGLPLQYAVDDGCDFAERHFTDTAKPVTVTPDDDVEVGFWEREGRTFTPIPRDHADVTQLASCATLPCINAVRVRTYRDSTHSGTVPISFAGVMGKSTQEVAATAVAVTGGPCDVECADLPIVLPDCGISSFVGPPCVGGLYKVKFQTDTTDTGAWSTLQPESGGGAELIKCLLEEALVNPGGRCSASTECKLPKGSTDTDIETTDPVWVINGTVKTACDLVTELYRLHPDYTYVVPVVEATCPGQKWNQTHTVNSFATVRIDWAPEDCGGEGHDKHFMVEVLCGETTDRSEEGGCVSTGTWLETPRLVQ